MESPAPSTRPPARWVVTGLLAASVLALPGPAAAQGPPGTDVYLLPMVDGRPAAGPPRNATARPGYDNQPHFTPDGSALLFTSVREDGQADTYRLTLPDGLPARVTRTTESEYSPTVTPDGGGFSVVRVEADSTQRLWRFGLDGGAPRLLLERVAPVGYHAWVDDRTVVLFVLGDPATLQVAELGSGTAREVARGVGRSLHRVPGRSTVSFTRLRDGERWIDELDPASGHTVPLAPALPESEDLAWTPDGRILMASGSVLHEWDPRAGAPGWRPIRDFGPDGLQGITRLAVSPDGRWLALVAGDAERR